MAFTHLHVHSHYSLLDGLPKIGQLIKTAKKRGFSAIALTDYNALYGAISFYEKCLADGIKPIIGAELYMAPHGIATRETAGTDVKVHHIVLLAKNYEGYKSLMKLISVGQIDGLLNGKPRIDKAILREHAHDLIALTGCMDGVIPQVIRSTDDQTIWEREVREYVEIFGEGNLYLELQDHPEIDGQVSMNNTLVELGRRMNVPVVATRDVHYLNPEDSEAQDIVTCIRMGRQVSDPSRPKMLHVDRSLNDETDMRSRFEHVPEAIDNTQRIVDACNVEIPLGQWFFPPIPIPEGKTADQELEDQTWARLPALMELTDDVRARARYELDIIKTKGYAAYFLAVADYVQWARDNGIVETTRGSAAGSLVSYALNITTVDPLYFKLPFERFLNPERPSAPDIDTDFADDRRDEVHAYVTRKYGADKVAQILTFGTMAARAAARDAGRALGLSYNFCDQVAKLIPIGAQGFPMTIERALKEALDLKKLFDANEDVQRLLTIAQKIEGNVRHTSIHAAGVVIAATTLTDFTPIQREVGGDKITTQYEMKSVEAAGLLKMDFLGIRNLSILGNAVQLIDQIHGEKIDIMKLPFDDKLTYEMLARGETMGVFQLSGSGMTRYLKDLRPSTIFDIMAMVALFRPGPMESIPEYIERKHGRKPVMYMDPRLEAVMDKSFGIMVYQDDVMLTAITLAHYSWLDADKLRKAMGKKIPEEMAQQKEKFMKGCVEYGGLTKEKTEEIWKLIEPFAAYGFNKAHAASYAVVAYQTAYLKAHYPVCYMAAVLTAETGDNDKIASIVAECRRMDIEVSAPHINESFEKFTVVSTGSDGTPMQIRFGLSAVKNVGEHICQVMIRERREHGPFTSLENLLDRVHDRDMNRKSLESLIKVGALDCFGYERGLLLSNIESIITFCKESAVRATTNQESLFFGSGMELATKVALAEAPAASDNERLGWEKELLGLYISGHPLTVYEKRIGRMLVSIPDVETKDPGAWVTIAGIVRLMKKKITQKGKVMAFVTVEDVHGSLELLVFPKAYEGTEGLWVVGKIVAVMGRKGKEAGDNKLMVEKAYELTEETMDGVVSQLTGGADVKPTYTRTAKKSSSDAPLPAPAEPEPYRAPEPPAPLPQAVITIPAEATPEMKAALKTFFANNLGDHQVVLEVGGQKVITGYRIMWDEAVQTAVRAMLTTSSPTPTQDQP